MITLYKVFLFFHVSFAIIWLGSVVTLEALGWRAQMSRKIQELQDLATLSEWLTPRVFIPSALGTLLFGMLMVVFGKPNFDQLWIILGLVGIALSSFIGGRLIGPTTKKILSLSEKKNVKYEKVEKQFNKLALFTHLDLAILFILVFDMIIKPKITSTSFFIVSGIFLVLVASYSFYIYKKS